MNFPEYISKFGQKSPTSEYQNKLVKSRIFGIFASRIWLSKRVVQMSPTEYFHN